MLFVYFIFQECFVKFKTNENMALDEICVCWCWCKLLKM